MKLLHPPPPSLSNTVCQDVDPSVCFYSLYAVKRPVPLLLFTFSHSQPPPLHTPLFVPDALIDRLFISGPAAASAPGDEIVMVSVIFCNGDKDEESQREEIESGTRGSRYGKHPVFYATVILQNVSVWRNRDNII